MNWWKNASNPKISYSAVVLDEDSHNRLMLALKNDIPDGWKTFAHHMTINMGPLKGDRSDLGKLVKLTASAWAKSDKALAVAVDGFARRMPGVAHITVAVNVAGGGKPKDSNELNGWIPLEEPLILQGSVEEIPQP